MPMAIPFSFSVCSFSVHPSIIIFANFHYSERFHCSYRGCSVASLDPRWWSGIWVMTFCVIWNYRNRHRINRVRVFFSYPVCARLVFPLKNERFNLFLCFRFFLLQIGEREREREKRNWNFRIRAMRSAPIHLFSCFFFIVSTSGCDGSRLSPLLVGTVFRRLHD